MFLIKDINIFVCGMLALALSCLFNLSPVSKLLNFPALRFKSTAELELKNNNNNCCSATLIKGKKGVSATGQNISNSLTVASKD